MYLSSLAIDDKACDHTPPSLAFKHTGATVDVVAKVDSGHGHCVDYQAALKGIRMMEGEEGSGLKDCMGLAACTENKSVAVSACIGISALVKALESTLSLGESTRKQSQSL